MNNFKTYPSNEGNGIYGWDLVNPYLQELYRQQENDDDEPKNQNPPYLAPLPGEATPAMPFGEISKRETPIPLKPDYPVNPEPQQPTEEPRKLHSLTEGLNLAGKRIWNDLKYARGYIQDKFADDEMDKAAQSALENLPEYENSSDAQLQQKADSLENEVERQPIQQPRIELKGLEEYRRLRDEDIPRGEIAKQLSETARWGNEGRRIMEEARATENAFPETEGWATAGEFVADIARMGIPVAIGALSAPAGVIAGGASVGSAVTESFSQAQMELDNFEEETGEKLPTAQRAAYTAICVGADFLFDALLQSRYLKNLSTGVKNRASNYFKKEILKNKASRTEMVRLMKNLKKTDRSGVVVGAMTDALASGAASGLSSATHDLAQTIYVNPKEYPSLSSILETATANMITGGVVGGLGRTINIRKKNARRNKQENIPIIEQGEYTWEVLDYDPENRTATVLTPVQRKPFKISDIDPDKIYSVSVKDYNQNHKNINKELNEERKTKKEMKEPDPFAPIVPDAAKDEAWQQMSMREKYYLAKDLAKRMGLEDVLIYEKESDLPPSILEIKPFPEGVIRGFEIDNGPIGIVLEYQPSYANLQQDMLHEAVGHRGFDALFPHPALKHEFFKRVYKSMPKKIKEGGSRWFNPETLAQEYVANIASKGVRSSEWYMIARSLRTFLRTFYPGLRFSDAELRQLIVESRDALEYDSFIRRRRKKYGDPDPSESQPMGTPMTEVGDETYRLLWENDPQWQRYKRFYDEVYGPEDGSASSNPPAPSEGEDNNP